MSFKRFEMVGILHYSVLEPGVSYKLTTVVDPGVAEFYRKLVPKHQKCQPGRYAPHVTVVRNELPTDMEKWGLYEGKEVVVEYDNIPKYDGTYWWLDCYSEFLEQVREDLGLPRYAKWNMPPDGKACFHMTIGNSK